MLHASKAASPGDPVAKVQSTEPSAKAEGAEADFLEKGNGQSSSNKVVLSTMGTVIPEQLVEVNARVPAQVVKLLVQPGSTAKTGDLLAQLDPEPFRQDVDRLHAKIEVAQAHLAQAKAVLDSKSAGYERVNSAHAQATVSAADLDEAKSALQLAQAAVAQAEGELKLAKVDLQLGEYNLANTQIRAPIDGVILHKYTELGESVDPKAAAGQGGRLYDMADLHHLAVRFNVPDAYTVILGQRCVIVARDPAGTVGNAGRPLCQAKVIRVGGAVDPNTGTFPVEAGLDSLPKRQVLRPGSVLRVDLLTPD
jgi:membrane fusion protein (multidrug efflux system)